MAEGTANEKSENIPQIGAKFSLARPKTSKSLRDDSGSKNDSSPIRGAIKTVITTSTDNLVAGDFFFYFSNYSKSF